MQKVGFFADMRRIFTRNKIFIQRAMGYMTILNSGMILFLLLSKLQEYGIQIHITKWFFPIFIVSVFLMILIGYLDFKLGVHKEEFKLAQKQNPYFTEINDRLERIEKVLSKRKI